MSTVGGVSSVTLQGRVFLGKPYNPHCAFTQVLPSVCALCWVSAAEIPTTKGAAEVILVFAIGSWGRSAAGHDVQHILLIFQQVLMQERQLREIPKGIAGKEAPQD